MSIAALTADLLAPKGTASPLSGVYEHPMQKPVLTFPQEHKPTRTTRKIREQAHRGERAERRQDRDFVRMSCRLDPEHHRQLRFLAARDGKSIQSVLRVAIADFLEEQGGDCPCLKSPGECCRN